VIACEICDGVGATLTEAGLIVVALVERHLRRPAA
jgi:hypothetical protein